MVIHTFGIAKDIIGERKLILKQSFTDVGELRRFLLEKYPEFQELNSLRVAVNEAYAEDEHLLNDHDEVVLIPPVSGG